MNGATQALGGVLVIVAILAIIAGGAAVFTIIGALAAIGLVFWVIGTVIGLMIQEAWTGWRASKDTRQPPGSGGPHPPY